MTKRMKKKLVAICISCAVVFTGPGMSMVTRAYADEITQDQQQDGNSANAQVSPGEDENNQADNTENSDDKLNDQNGQNQEDVVQDPTEEQAPEEETDQDAEEAQDEAEPQAEETVNGRTVVILIRAGILQRMTALQTDGDSRQEKALAWLICHIHGSMYILQCLLFHR